MTWTTGALKRFDRQLLAPGGYRDAGTNHGSVLSASGREPELANIEMAYLRKNGKTHIREVKRTVFGVKRTGSGLSILSLARCIELCRPDEQLA